MEVKEASLGRIENLEYQIEDYIKTSQDREFTDYLRNLADRLQGQKYQIDVLQDELNTNYQRYEDRMRMRRQAQLMKEQMQQEAAAQNAVPEQNTMPIQGMESVQNANAVLVQNAESVQNTVSAPMQSAEPIQNPIYMPNPAQVQAQMSATPAKKDNVEFVIGVTVLSIIGAAFILTALVLLGMNYMNGFVKGMGLYVVCIGVLVLSELVIYRKLPKLGCVFSAISIGGIYLSTVLNFLVLHNFNIWVTLVVAMAVTVMAVLLSRKRDSLVYRVIGMIAGYLCFFMIQVGITNIEFLVVSGMVFLLSILCIALPTSKGRTAINCVHMIINAIFTLSFIIRAQDCGVTDLNYIFTFLASATMVMNLLLVVQVLYHKRCIQDNIKIGDNSAILTTYGVCAFLLSVISAFLLEDIYYNTREAGGSVILAASVAAGVLGVISIIAFVVLFIKKCPEKWAIYYYLNFALWIVFAWTETHLTKYEYLPEQIVLIVLLLISKILSLRKIKELKASDTILTVYICVHVWISSMMGTKEAYQDIILVGGVLLSIWLLSQWKTYQETILTLTLAVYAYNVLPSLLKLPAATGLFFVGILAFNNVKRWKDDKILIYNILALAGQICCFLLLWNPVYYQSYITYLCMLVFGLATIILTFDDKYQMGFKGKDLILAIFLTYMAFVIRTGGHVVNSILLMIVALVCVGTGFAKAQKRLRIYGLVLSLLVCAKIALFDFMEAPTLQKTILFFTVGVIALIIAGIYIILEKKRSDTENKKQNNIVQREGQAAAGQVMAGQTAVPPDGQLAQQQEA